ncbi:WD repeat-containing protein 82 [Drosophila eugracilis]|uniref:WD repeat-containing protein 82 n=1 Tax=Drosophila eugracilis TaxID=29029 RepID=UPI001BD9D338|nr:WD repeat-containing protein 82 [Drosophila eugracilis]
MSMRLNDDAMRQFRVAKVFQETDDYKLSLDFSLDGRRLLSCDRSALSVFSSIRQTELCRLHMSHYLPKVACFTHRDTRVLHSTSKHNFAVRCLDLEANRCIRVFSGHTKSAHTLAPQPGCDYMFISVGLDDRVYMWDFRTSSHTYLIKNLRAPLCAYDPAGLVVATSTGTERIEIHDVRMLAEKPCLKFVYQVNDSAKWTQLQFAPNGKTLLLSTDHSWCFSVSAFDGSFQQSFTGYSNRTRVPLEASYTPDSQFILSGADEGRIHIWRAVDGYPVAVLKGNNVGPVSCLRFSPKATMFVSSDLLIAFWMPMANGVYDWDEPLHPGELASFKEEEEPKQDVEVPRAIPMPKPIVDIGMTRMRLRRKRAQNEIPIVDLTINQDRDSMEDGELSDD